MDIFKEEWAKRGGVLTDVSSADYMKETDFYTHLTKVIAGKPDAILLIGASEPSALIVKQARELGFKGRFIISEQAKLEEMVKIVHGLLRSIGLTPTTGRLKMPLICKAYKNDLASLLSETPSFMRASAFSHMLWRWGAQSPMSGRFERPCPRCFLWRNEGYSPPRVFLA
jgi:hypothetical protein